MSDASESPVDLEKPRAGCWFFLLPLAVGLVIVVGYGSLFLAGARGRPAGGDVARMVFSGCPAALSPVRERVAAMGLGEPSFEEAGDAFVVVARLPADPDSAASIPTALARVGLLDVVDGDEVVLTGHVASAVMRIDLVGEPSTAVRLDEEGARILRDHMVANPAGRVAFRIDGEVVGERANESPEAEGRVEIKVVPGDRAWRVRVAAERGVVLNHGPLPCAPAVEVH